MDIITAVPHAGAASRLDTAVLACFFLIHARERTVTDAHIVSTFTWLRSTHGHAHGAPVSACTPPLFLHLADVQCGARSHLGTPAARSSRRHLARPLSGPRGRPPCLHTRDSVDELHLVVDGVLLPELLQVGGLHTDGTLWPVVRVGRRADEVDLCSDPWRRRTRTERRACR